MHRPVRRSVAITVTFMPGAEPWIRIAHPTGWFKLPATAACSVLWDGVVGGWGMTPRHVVHAGASVTVPLERLRQLEAAEARLRLTEG